MLYSEIYANRISDLCAQRKITVNHLAYLCGLKQSTIDNIIHGKSKNPTVLTLHKISLAFNMTLSEFLDFPELNNYNVENDE